MYINFDDSRPETPRLDRSLTALEQALLTLLGYACLVILILIWPHLAFVKAWEAQQQAAQQAELLREQNLARQTQFVFSVPRPEFEKTPLRRPDLSDETHRAESRERPPEPKNDRPFSHGNALDNMPAPPPTPARTAPSTTPSSQPPPVDPNAVALPKSPLSTIARNDPSKTQTPAYGVLSDAIRHVDRYAQGQTLQNPQGGADLGPSIQFDTKGVDFGWWMRRFRAQVYQNWLIPYAAVALHGHVVITFWIHRDGTITDVRVVQPSAIDAFTKAAYNAIIASNPTLPLPKEYPDEQGQMTVIFYYNEMPPDGGGGE